MKGKGDEFELTGEKVETKIYLDRALRDLAAADCEKRNVAFTDLVAELLADYYERPDLARVPRKVVGRKLGTKMPSRKKK